ncbi:MAG: cell wall-binding repeat-containing protein [Candidatus Andersenbacteria bacterium]
MTKNEIARIFDQATDTPTDLFVIGGASAVNGAVVASIQAISSTLNVQRISGADRIETAINVAKPRGHLRGAPPTTAFLARSSDYPDALAASSYAGNVVFYPSFAPVLLTATTRSIAESSRTSRPANPTLVQAYLMGGTTALSSSVASDVSALTTTTRLGGANRYATAVTAAKNFFPTGPTAVGVASGQNFPDALVLGPFVGKQDLAGQTASYSMPTLLVKTASIPAGVSATSARLRQRSSAPLSSGRTAAVSNAVVSSLTSLY